MQHPTKFRKIVTQKEKNAFGTRVIIFDANTCETIFEVRRTRNGKEFELLSGHRCVFHVAFTNSCWSDHKETIVKLCGEPKNVNGHGSKSLNPNFNQWQELSLKGFVKVAEHLAQFETTNFNENTRLAELERKLEQ